MSVFKGLKLLLVTRLFLQMSETNAALQGVADQSSIGYGGLASCAIDRKKSANFRGGSCTHTNTDSPSSWRVNLKSIHKISTVIVTNREDCSHERIRGAEIHVGDSLYVSKNVRCGTITSVTPGSVHIVSCHRMIGRYVNVVLPPGPQYLSLCEVEVCGVLWVTGLIPECN